MFLEEVINTDTKAEHKIYSKTREDIIKDMEEEMRHKSLAYEKAHKLERLIKIFKMLLHQFTKPPRGVNMTEEEKEKGKELKEEGLKILNIEEFGSLFHLYSKCLSKINDTEISDTIKLVGVSMFICFQEDFKRIEQKVFTADFDNPHIVMQDYHDAEKKEIKSFIDEKYFEDERVKFFVDLCSKHIKIFNSLIRQNISLMRDSLKHMIYVVPHIFDFDNKHHFFRQEIKRMKRAHGYNPLRIDCKRDNFVKIFQTSYDQINALSPEDWKGKLEVTFIGERGQDAGGLTREWFTEISKQMFNPNLGIFKLSDSGSTYYPNPKSFIQNNHTSYFKFIGRILGKALLEEQYITCSFLTVLYKIIRGVPISWHDVEDYDNVYYKNLKWILENDVTSLCQTFSETIDFFGKSQVKDLIPDGSNILVTNENKNEFVQKVSFFRLYISVKDEIDAFLGGFYDLIPRKLISIFDHGEIELLISGLPTIDIDDMRANTQYTNYTENTMVIQWFWEIMNEFTNQEKAEFLQFVTGSSKVPIEGFSALQGMRGPQKFQIQRATDKDYNRLPISHTCFNQLDLPEYPNKDLLRERLLYAINEGKGSFQLA